MNALFSNVLLLSAFMVSDEIMAAIANSPFHQAKTGGGSQLHYPLAIEVFAHLASAHSIDGLKGGRVTRCDVLAIKLA